MLVCFMKVTLKIECKNNHVDLQKGRLFKNMPRPGDKQIVVPKMQPIY